MPRARPPHPQNNSALSIGLSKGQWEKGAAVFLLDKSLTCSPHKPSGRHSILARDACHFRVLLLGQGGGDPMRVFSVLAHHMLRFYPRLSASP
ncbi:hypothetical protein [Gluconobacter sphaericus]|uniref:hypothetical protein n=1 Tax=Gluconobacter sphaericus TaxID=574987 RepID=UPI001B8CF8DB|nr:hypothetical protein [Gluconobacter sphaericus]